MCILHTCFMVWWYVRLLVLASVAQSDMRPTGNQEITGSIPTGSGSILS